MTTKAPHARHPNPDPPGDEAVDTTSVPFGEAAIGTITRSCTAIDTLHPAGTLTADRVHDHTRDIRQAAREIDAENTRLADLLLEAQQEAGA